MNMKHNAAVRYRPDIDGLRAIAVLSVVVFHFFPSIVTGGFVGVDIFFVISGYLISSILFKNLQKGEFRFFDFYARRIKRIFPSLIVVLFFCLTFGYFVLLAGEYKQLGKHTVAGSLFFSNFAFLSEFVDYFNVAAELKPLLHLWSLGIEEQFYIVWPFVLYLAWRLRLNLFFITGAFALSSLVWNLIEFKLNPIYTFYLPYTRIWELLFGAMLAWAHISKVNVVSSLISSVTRKWKFAFFSSENFDSKVLQIRNIQSCIGFVFVLGSVCFFNKTTPFPGFFAVIPVIGAVMLIASGPDAIVNRRILGAKPMVIIGLISFPLYLWHWPLLSFSNILGSGTPPLGWRIAAMILAFLFSYFTWQFVEKKLRFRENWKVPASLSLVMILIAIIGLDINKRDGWKFRVTQYEKTAQIFESWQIADPACMEKFKSTYGNNLVYCLVGDANKTPDAVLIGDSHANALAYGLIENFSNRGLNLLHMGLGACPPFFGIEADPTRPCPRESKTLEILEKDPKIKKIIMNSRGPRYLTGRGFGDGEDRDIGVAKYLYRPDIADPKQAFRLAMRDTLQRFTNAGKEIIFITDVPEISFDPKGCVLLRPLFFNLNNVRKDCEVSRIEFDKRNKDYHELVKEVLINFPKVKLWEPWRYFCDMNRCTAMVDGKLLYRDKHHLSLEGSYWLGEKFESK